MVSNHSEKTFERLRYSLGGDRPSQTAHLTVFPSPIQGCFPFQTEREETDTYPTVALCVGETESKGLSLYSTMTFE